MKWFEYKSPPKEELEKQIANIERGLKEGAFTDNDWWEHILRNLKKKKNDEN